MATLKKPKSLEIDTTPKNSTATADSGGSGSGWREIPTRAWVSFVMGCIVMLVAGTQYAFSAWSDDFKQERGFTQTEVEVVGAMGNTGSYVGVIGGMIFDVYGTRAALLLAAFMAFVGFFPMYLTSAGFAPPLENVGAQGFFYLIALFGCITAYFATLGCNAQAFPAKHRGIVLGSLLGFFALCATLYTGIYNGVFGHDLAGFQLMLSILAPAVFIVGAFLLAPSAGANRTQLNKQDYKTLPEDEEVLEERESAGKRVLKVFIEKMRSFTFWLLFIQWFVGAGCGFLFINNIGQLSKALNAGRQDASVVFACVTLFSICSAVGRVATGLTDHVHVKRGWWVVGVNLGNAIAYLVAALAFTDESFTIVYVVTILLGLVYGALNGLVAVVISEKWGTESFAQNFGWLLFVSVGASYAFNGFAGRFYDREAIVHPGPDSANDCVGTICYRLSFFISAGLGLFAGITGLLLAPRTCYPGEGKSDEIPVKREKRIRSSISVHSAGA